MMPQTDLERVARAATALLAGPRGRRLLLEFALASEETRLADSDGDVDHLHQAVFFASISLEPDASTIMVYSPAGVADASELPVVSAEEVAERLDQVRLVEATGERLRRCLAASTEAARYWQQPDGEDTLAATPPVRAALHRIAAHIAASPAAAWWWSPVDLDAQWLLTRGDDDPAPLPEDPGAALRRDRRALARSERRAARRPATDPAAAFSADWGCAPLGLIPESTRAIGDAGPLGLDCVEDGMGWDRTTASRLEIPEDARVFEAASGADWAELCRRFPLEQTHSKRHDWHATTGRDGRWVMPDWAAVAEQYDAVHLQVGAYLEAAGTAIPIDCGPGPSRRTDRASRTGAATGTSDGAGAWGGAATVIAGVAPDTTFWLASRVRVTGQPVSWRMEERGAVEHWSRA